MPVHAFYRVRHSGFRLRIHAQRLDSLGCATSGCAVVFVGGTELERHPIDPDTVRYNASNQAAMLDLDTGKVLVLPNMLVHRADPAVVSVAPTALRLDEREDSASSDPRLYDDADNGCEAACSLM